MKKKLVKISFYLLLAALTVYILAGMFRENGSAFAASLLRGSWRAHSLVLLCALLYTTTEGCITAQLARRYQPKFSWWAGIVNSFYVAFHKVITFGTGSIVAMMVHLRRYDIPPETSYGLGTIQYVMHRVGLAIYATACALWNHTFFLTYFQRYTIFIYLSYGVTMVVAIGLLGVCLSRRVHTLVLWLATRLGLRRRYPRQVGALERKMEQLQRQTVLLLQSKKHLGVTLLLELVKLSCWFIIPYIALSGMGALAGLTLGQAISIIAIVTVLIGVIPTPGNIASIEIIYTLLFTVVVGEVAAGATMLLYRFATFYLPFLVGMVVTLVLKARDVRQNGGL